MVMVFADSTLNGMVNEGMIDNISRIILLNINCTICR